MSLVASEGSRRIGPKVFADVPSASELTAVRRSRNWLAILLILAIGALIAGWAAFTFLTDRVQDAEGDASEQVQTLQREKQELLNRVAQYEDPRFHFDDVIRLATESSQLREDIRSKLAGEKPGDVPPARIVEGTEYVQPPRWETVRQNAITSLTEELDGTPRRPGLRVTEQRVRTYTNPTPAGVRPTPGVRTNPGSSSNP